MLPSIMPLPVSTEAFPRPGEGIDKTASNSIQGNRKKLPRKPSQSRIRSTALPRGELFGGAADSVLALSVTCGDSSPKGRALGSTIKFPVPPKAPSRRGLAATNGSRRRGFSPSFSLHFCPLRQKEAWVRSLLFYVLFIRIQIIPSGGAKVHTGQEGAAGVSWIKNIKRRFISC